MFISLFKGLKKREYNYVFEFIHRQRVGIVVNK